MWENSCHYQDWLALILSHPPRGGNTFFFCCSFPVPGSLELDSRLLFKDSSGIFTVSVDFAATQSNNCYLHVVNPLTCVRIKTVSKSKQNQDKNEQRNYLLIYLKLHYYCLVSQLGSGDGGGGTMIND